MSSASIALNALLETSELTRIETSQFFSTPKMAYTVRVTAAEAPGGSAYSNYFGGTLMKRNLVVLTK